MKKIEKIKQKIPNGKVTVHFWGPGFQVLGGERSRIFGQGRFGLMVI